MLFGGNVQISAIHQLRIDMRIMQLGDERAAGCGRIAGGLQHFLKLKRIRNYA